MACFEQMEQQRNLPVRAGRLRLGSRLQLDNLQLRAGRFRLANNLEKIPRELPRPRLGSLGMQEEMVLDLVLD